MMKYRIEWLDYNNQPGEPVIIEADSPDEAVMKAWSAERPHIVRVIGGGEASGEGTSGATGSNGGLSSPPSKKEGE
jgi:hypothetical protein